MDKQVTSKAIKELNPENISGIIKEALDLQINLKKSAGNPRMVDAVGAATLMAAFQSVMKLFAPAKQLPQIPHLTLLQILQSLPVVAGLTANLQLTILKEFFGLIVPDKLLTITQGELDALVSLLKSHPELNNYSPLYQTIIDNTAGYVTKMITIRG